MNLQQRRRLWYAVHDIPADVRPLFGDKLKFVQSLKTPDKNIAKAKAAALEAEWRTKIDIARGKATVEDDSYWITRAKAATSATEKKAVMSALGAQVFDKEEALYEQHGDSYTETDEYKRLERLQGIASGQIVALDSHVDEWIGTLSDQKKSKDMKKATVLRFVAAGFATVQDVQRKAVQGWINRLASIENKAPATVQRSLSELRSYWRYLVALEIASEEPDPFEKLQLPRNVTTGDERKPFTAQQVVDLLGAAKAKRTPDPALVDLITIGMWTGARIEEICAMKIAQVEDGFLSIIDAKTAAGWRQVPIHPKLKPTIDRLKGTRTDGYLLVNLSENKYGDRSNAIGKRFGILKTKLKFGEDYVFHSIRKTVATLLENAKVPENVAADILGHEKPTMTYGLYSGGNELQVKMEALEKLSYPGF